VTDAAGGRSDGREHHRHQRHHDRRIDGHESWGLLYLSSASNIDALAGTIVNAGALKRTYTNRPKH
jgi:hypothetical protein